MKVVQVHITKLFFFDDEWTNELAEETARTVILEIPEMNPENIKAVDCLEFCTD